MLSKKNRADKKAVEKIFKEGKFINSPNLTLKFIRGPKSEGFFTNKKEFNYSLQKPSPQRLSVIVPKSVAKLAVKRNLLRRRGYMALQKHLKDFPSGVLGVFVFRKPEEDILILENEIKTILNKIN